MVVASWAERMVFPAEGELHLPLALHHVLHIPMMIPFTNMFQDGNEIFSDIKANSDLGNAFTQL
jgi:hypothetical protein